MSVAAQRRALLVITGGIAAYKTLDLIRRGRERGWSFTCAMTRASTQFVTPLSVAALSENKFFEDLFSLTDEAEMGHIRLSRMSDLVVVAPASADFMAKMAHGIADDLPSTLLLATDKPVLIAPAMNPEMWAHPATVRNLESLRQDGVHIVGPEAGLTACGEMGAGRMSEPLDILAAMATVLDGTQRLKDRRAIVTSGPTYEAIDPVRFVGNRSSGKQGHAIASALAQAGATVTLVTGPVALPDPPGVQVIHIESARQMAEAVENSLPADIAVCAAAVADWRPAHAAVNKIKKQPGTEQPVMTMIENPDILAGLSKPSNRRPKLVIGFAAETENVIEHAQAKLTRKGCDWILANHVGAGSNVFGGADNQITLIGKDLCEVWPSMDKASVAERLVAQIAETLSA